MKRQFLSLLIILCVVVTGKSQTQMAQILGDSMVLQQMQEVSIWGTDVPKHRIEIRSEWGSVAKVKTDGNGKWMAKLVTPEAGGPYSITIEGSETISFENILIGEVWLCGGQSNMEMAMRSMKDCKQRLDAANYPYIRIFDVPHQIGEMPMDTFPEAHWHAVTPKSIAGFSGVGYFFGEQLHKKLDIPIGLIGCDWGGTNVETWTSEEAMEPFASWYVDSLLDDDPYALGETLAELKSNYPAFIKSFGEDDTAFQANEIFWAKNDLDDRKWKMMQVPGSWESQGLTSLNGNVWFRKTLDVPVSFTGKQCVLSLGSIDDADVTYVNGITVGQTEKYDEKRVYKVPVGVFKKGENVVTVKVYDKYLDGGFTGKTDDIYLSCGEDTLPLNGDWKYRIDPNNWSVEKPMKQKNSPSHLYNGMVYPIKNVTIKGAIWYQGESNTGQALRYAKLFPNMIKDWRDKFENPEMPFLFVQLANFMEKTPLPVESNWALLRDAQLKTLKLENTGMAVSIDIGEADNIHPGQKWVVGERLSYIALDQVYYQTMVHSGPIYKSMKVDSGKVELTFDHIGTGLKTMNKYGFIEGFQIAGEDRKFQWAKAMIKGEKVMVWSEGIAEPVAVRYAWADNPEAQLYNEEGLPASPFRTDAW